MIVVLAWMGLHLNPHPPKSEGAAPKFRLYVRGEARLMREWEHQNGLEGVDLLGSLLWLHL